MNRILVLLLAVLFSGLLRGAPVVVFVSIPTGLEPVVEIGGNAIEARSLLTTSGSPESFTVPSATASVPSKSERSSTDSVPPVLTSVASPVSLRAWIGSDTSSA